MTHRHKMDTELDNKISDSTRESHIIQFLTLLEGIAMRINSDHVLVGTDLNHRMDAFQNRNRKMDFCANILQYNYPNDCQYASTCISEH